MPQLAARLFVRDEARQRVNDGADDEARGVPQQLGHPWPEQVGGHAGPAQGKDLPDDEATTIAGLVIHEARMIPDAGQVFTFHGFRFQVLRKSRNRITALRITPLTARGRRAAE